MGLAGYPTLRVMALAETGTRGLLGATVGSATVRDETALARRLLHLLGPGMLVLLDRAFDANAFLAGIAGTGAMPLARATCVVWLGPALVARVWGRSHLVCHWLFDRAVIAARVSHDLWDALRSGPCGPQVRPR